MSAVAEAEQVQVTGHCDECGINNEGQPVAHAKVRVVFLSGSLIFCGHHFAKHEDALRGQAIEIIDGR